MSFDKIITESFELQKEVISIDGKDGSYNFTVNELSPFELAKCFDEFGTLDFVSVIARSVRDEKNMRMTKEQAERLPAEVVNKFINSYVSLMKKDNKEDDKKKA